MGQNISSEEEAIVKILLHILSMRGLKYEESNIRRLLVCCRTNGYPTEAEKAFKIELWDDIGQKLWDKVSDGDKEAKSLATAWKLIISTLKEFKAERAAVTGIFAVLQPDKNSKSNCEAYPVRVFNTLLTPSPVVPSAPPVIQQSGAEGGKLPSGWPPVPSHDPGETKKSKELESDNLSKGLVKVENAKVVDKCNINSFTDLCPPSPLSILLTPTREQKEPPDKNWAKELCERSDQLLASESNSQQYQAMREVPETNKAAKSFATVNQGPNENYVQFIDHLQETINKQIENLEVKEALVLKLAVENANVCYQHVICEFYSTYYVFLCTVSLKIKQLVRNAGRFELQQPERDLTDNTQTKDQNGFLRNGSSHG
ncbi:uncharacterized protein [Patagioenas fasciata]|uniref:uncharacterized protein isoform X2 n=1 Tax=Patagioenas fasciata TaxID=372321 RepID=UPI003A99B9BE